MQLFDAASSIPIHVSSFGKGKPSILASTFVRRNNQNEILLLDSEFNFSLLTKQPQSKEDNRGLRLLKGTQKSEKLKLFSNMYGSSVSAPASSKDQPISMDAQTLSSTLKFLPEISYMAAPPAAWAGDFLKSLLKVKPVKKVTEKDVSQPPALAPKVLQEDLMQVDEKMENSFSVDELDSLADILSEQRLQETPVPKEVKPSVSGTASNGASSKLERKKKKKNNKQ
jgi:hypothetical protein